MTILARLISHKTFNWKGYGWISISSGSHSHPVIRKRPWGSGVGYFSTKRTNGPFSLVANKPLLKKKKKKKETPWPSVGKQQMRCFSFLRANRQRNNKSDLGVSPYSVRQTNAVYFTERRKKGKKARASMKESKQTTIYSLVYYAPPERETRGELNQKGAFAWIGSATSCV